MEESLQGFSSDEDSESVISERSESDYESQYDSSDSNYELERLRLTVSDYDTNCYNTLA